MIQSLLFRWCRQVLQLHDNVTTTEIDKRRREMGLLWHSRAQVSYEDEKTQCAYVRSDLPLRASALTQLLLTHPHLFAVFSHNALVEVVAIGCGPATEMLGILNFLIQSWSGKLMHSLPLLRFLLVDRQKSWAPLIDQFETVVRQSSPIPLLFEKSFYQWDLGRGDEEGTGRASGGTNVAFLPSTFTADIFTFSMLFSEVLKQGFSSFTAARKNIQDIFQNAKLGAVFVFMDINQAEVVSGLLDLLEPSVFSPRNCLRYSCLQSFGICVEDLRREMGEYFGAQCPLVSGHMFCLMYAKIEIPPVVFL